MENNVSKENFLEYSQGIIAALRAIREGLKLDEMSSTPSDEELSLRDQIYDASNRICSLLCDLNNVNAFLKLRSSHFDFVDNFAR